MTHTDTFHYPPELFELLVETIPILSRSKKSVLIFFRGEGISEKLYKDISDRLDADKESINKYEISRTILTRINEKSDTYIRVLTPYFLD